MSGEEAVLLLDHVAKSYEGPEGQPVEVVRDVTLGIRAGETVAVTGPSGSGKSTLLNLMGALDTPTAGLVRLNGRDLAFLPERELARVRNREIGFVFQLHHLLPQCTVLENVLVPTLPRRDRAHRTEDSDRAHALLDKVGLSARVNHRPAALSGGERQRVAVVRALINRPHILLADEPTGSLDRAGATALGELLISLNRDEGTALVVVTHSAELAALMDRRYALDNGVLKECSE